MKKIAILLVLIPLLAKAQSDSPCNAVFLSVHNDTCGFITGTTAGASYQTNAANGGTPPCASPGSPDVWYAFVVPASGAVAVTAKEGSINDGGMAVYSGTCGNLQFIECDDDDGMNMMPVIDRSDYVPGDTIYVRFWKAWGSGTGTFGICAIESHSDCRTCIPVCSEFRYNGNPYGAGSDHDANGTKCDINEYQSIWLYFRFLTSGTFKFTLIPDSIFYGYYPDWDWLLYKDTVVNFCTAYSLSYPAYCCNGSSSMGPAGETGLDAAGTSLHVPGGPGNPYCPIITVNAGDEYYLLINNFTISATGFSLETGGTAQLDCGPVTGKYIDDPGQEVPYVFPNPGSGLFTFSRLEPGSTIRIYDISGRLISLNTYSTESITLDLHDRYDGVYMYMVISPSSALYYGRLSMFPIK